MNDAALYITIGVVITLIIVSIFEPKREGYIPPEEQGGWSIGGCIVIIVYIILILIFI